MLDCAVNGVLLVWESIWGLASRGTVVLELMLSNTSELPSPDITYLFYARLPQFSLTEEILGHLAPDWATLGTDDYLDQFYPIYRL